VRIPVGSGGGGITNAPAAVDWAAGDDDREGLTSGWTSDGKEVVAVWANAGVMTLFKVGMLEFRGSGATGELGLAWSVMVAVSAMCMWQRSMQTNITAGVTGGVVAGAT
jgi:hypothetical protein